jgi:predicted dehydrogenase
VEVYTPHGPQLFRNFGPKGDAKETPLKLPKVVHYPAMMRHLKRCMTAGEKPLVGPAEGLTLMSIIDSIYKSAESGKSVEVKAERATAGAAGAAASNVSPAGGSVE